MIWIGTSGYQYPEWKGTFYPPSLSTAKMLPFYAARFPTVEINYTFRRMPTEKVLRNWSDATPAEFTFTLKAPERITHRAKLANCADTLHSFCDVARVLESKLGVLLFQLPPFFRKDLPVLEDFLDAMPAGIRSAFEFRHPSWHDDAVFAALGAKNAALCIADSEKMSTPPAVTADYGYLRLRDEGYGEADIARWAEVVQERLPQWRDVFVYFKHEEEGKGPEFAQMLMRRLGLPAPGSGMLDA